jgi:hypothetical protein
MLNTAQTSANLVLAIRKQGPLFLRDDLKKFGESIEPEEIDFIIDELAKPPLCITSPSAFASGFPSTAAITAWYSNLNDRETKSKNANYKAMFRNTFDLCNNRLRQQLTDMAKSETESFSLDRPLKLEQHNKLRADFQLTCPEYLLSDDQILPKER